jgi:hypothetical protein
MSTIYAIAEHGTYDEWSYILVKLDEKNKEKFAEYCKQSKTIDERPMWALDLTHWVKDVEIIDRSSDNIITTQEIDKMIEKELEYIDELKEHHYLYEKKDLILELLEFLRNI